MQLIEAGDYISVIRLIEENSSTPEMTKAVRLTKDGLTVWQCAKNKKSAQQELPQEIAKTGIAPKKDALDVLIDLIAVTATKLLHRVITDERHACFGEYEDEWLMTAVANGANVNHLLLDAGAMKSFGHIAVADSDEHLLRMLLAFGMDPRIGTENDDPSDKADLVRLAEGSSFIDGSRLLQSVLAGKHKAFADPVGEAIKILLAPPEVPKILAHGTASKANIPDVAELPATKEEKPVRRRRSKRHSSNGSAKKKAVPDISLGQHNNKVRQKISDKQYIRHIESKSVQKWLLKLCGNNQDDFHAFYFWLTADDAEIGIIANVLKMSPASFKRRLVKICAKFLPLDGVVAEIHTQPDFYRKAIFNACPPIAIKRGRNRELAR